MVLRFNVNVTLAHASTGESVSACWSERKAYVCASLTVKLVTDRVSPVVVMPEAL